MDKKGTAISPFPLTFTARAAGALHSPTRGYETAVYGVYKHKKCLSMKLAGFPTLRVCTSLQMYKNSLT